MIALDPLRRAALGLEKIDVTGDYNSRRLSGLFRLKEFRQEPLAGEEVQGWRYPVFLLHAHRCGGWWRWCRVWSNGRRHAAKVAVRGGSGKRGESFARLAVDQDGDRTVVREGDFHVGAGIPVRRVVWRTASDSWTELLVQRTAASGRAPRIDEGRVSLCGVEGVGV